jgi:hypothetical protein
MKGDSASKWHPTKCLCVGRREVIEAKEQKIYNGNNLHTFVQEKHGSFIRLLLSAFSHASFIFGICSWA